MVSTLNTGMYSSLTECSEAKAISKLYTKVDFESEDFS